MAATAVKVTIEEKESYEAGTPVLVYLDEKVVYKNDVPAEDMTAIEKTLADEGYTYGVCLDLSLWKKLGNNAAVQIHDTNGNPIKITITIPDTTPKAEVTNTDNANKDNKISTGDKMHIGIIIMLMIDSAMAAFYLTLRKKKIK